MKNAFGTNSRLFSQKYARNKKKNKKKWPQGLQKGLGYSYGSHNCVNSLPLWNQFYIFWLLSNNCFVYFLYTFSCYFQVELELRSGKSSAKAWLPGLLEEPVNFTSFSSSVDGEQWTLNCFAALWARPGCKSSLKYSQSVTYELCLLLLAQAFLNNIDIFQKICLN